MQFPRIPTIALVIVALPWTLDASIAQPRAGCTAIANVNQLQAMHNDLAGSYCLVNDIDASAKNNFAPIGGVSTPFTGSLDGQGHIISNLTIRSGQSRVGLFGVASGAVIKDVTLQNVNVRSTAVAVVVAVGALAGFAFADAPNSTTISRVRVSGQVRCLVANCDAGGIFGAFGSFTGTKMLRDSSSSAAVTASRFVGGMVGVLQNATIQRSYATGAVSCTGSSCMAGGLVGRSSSGTMASTFATGPVAAANGADSRAGGLIGYGEGSATTLRSYAAGPVNGGATGIVGGLGGQWNATGPLDQTYAVGPVSSGGASTGGLFGNAFGGASITNSYWDTDTTGQATSAAGTGQTTAQLRTALPMGFGSGWGITSTLSYPFLNVDSIDFKSPLATLVRSSLVFTFLPISQFDIGQYLTPPAHADEAALATVFTMIARGVGIAHNDPKLKNVAIDRYFWDDATRTTRYRGPVKLYATLGPLMDIGAATPLDATNVITPMDQEKLVIVRGKYNDGSAVVRHWLLGTLYTKDGGNVVGVIAHDPLTGEQVTIDPATKKIVAPADFPFPSFRVTGYQVVTVN